MHRYEIIFNKKSLIFFNWNVSTICIILNVYVCGSETVINYCFVLFYSI